MKIFSLKISPAFPIFLVCLELETSLIELSILHSLYILFGWIDFHAATMNGKREKLGKSEKTTDIHFHRV